MPQTKRSKQLKTLAKLQIEFEKLNAEHKKIKEDNLAMGFTYYVSETNKMFLIRKQINILKQKLGIE